MKIMLALAVALAALALPAVAQMSNQMMARQGMMGDPGMGRLMMMDGGMAGCPMGGMMGSQNDHMDGRIAFLKAELHITSAQEKAWNDYAGVLRSVHDAMKGQMGQMRQGRMMGKGMRGGMMGQNAASGEAPAPAPQMMQMHIEHMQTALDNMKTLQAAMDKLYGALNDDQKKSADELLGMPCGMGWM